MRENGPVCEVLASFLKRQRWTVTYGTLRFREICGSKNLVLESLKDIECSGACS